MIVVVLVLHCGCLCYPVAGGCPLWALYLSEGVTHNQHLDGLRGVKIAVQDK